MAHAAAESKGAERASPAEVDAAPAVYDAVSVLRRRTERSAAMGESPVGPPVVGAREQIFGRHGGAQVRRPPARHGSARETSPRAGTSLPGGNEAHDPVPCRSRFALRAGLAAAARVLAGRRRAAQTAARTSCAARFPDRTAPSM